MSYWPQLPPGQEPAREAIIEPVSGPAQLPPGQAPSIWAQLPPAQQPLSARLRMITSATVRARRAVLAVRAKFLVVISRASLVTDFGVGTDLRKLRAKCLREGECEGAGRRGAA